MASSSSTAPLKRKNSLLEKTWSQKPEKKPRVATQAPSIHDQVRKAISYHFKAPNWRHHDIYCSERNGLTLYQRLTKDFTAIAKKEEKITRGKRYYENLEQLYAPASTPAKQMTPDKSLAFSDALREALVNAEMHPPNRSLLQEWLFQTENINQRECVGVFRWTEKLVPSQGSQQLHLGLQVMEMSARLQLATQFPDLVKSMHAKFAEILTQAGC